MKRATAVLLMALACAKPQPSADSTAAGNSATATPITPAAQQGTPPTQAPIGKTSPPADTVAIPVAAGASDVITGRVDEHGADPLTFIAITPTGGRQTRIAGGQLSLLSAVKGAEVWARGKREANGFRVDTFEVQRANNQAVADGIVSVSGTTVKVRTSSGTLTYPDAPSPLRDAAGSRVWITPPIKGQAPSFGVIRGKP